MKTTIDLPDKLFKQAKLLSASLGISFKELVSGLNFAKPAQQFQKTTYGLQHSRTSTV
jgi:hypothetical protein